MINVEDITQEHLAVTIQWLAKMSTPECWSLTDAEAASLLGETIENYKKIQQRVKLSLPVELTVETILRLSLLLGIWKELQLLVPTGREDLAFTWFNKPNNSPILRGRTIKSYLLENNTLDGFYIVRSYLNSQSR